MSGPIGEMPHGKWSMEVDRKLQAAVSRLADEVNSGPLKHVHEWQLTFFLVRRIKSTLAEQEIDLQRSEIAPLRPIVENFCDLYASGAFDHNAYDDFWCRFIGDWSKPRTLEGERLLDCAHRQAIDHPIMLTENLKCPRRTELASLAYYLQLMMGDQPILLPLRLLVDLLGITKVGVSKLRSSLVDMGLLVKVKDYVKHSRANEYLFQLDRTDLYTVD